jgi:hypothetical protein
MKLSWQLPRIVPLSQSTRSLTTNTYLNLHNRAFRSFGNRKTYFKSTTVTFQGNDVRRRVYLYLHCITVNNNNKNNCFFLSETFFLYFFHVHLNILNKVVSSLYAIFGTPCM